MGVLALVRVLAFGQLLGTIPDQPNPSALAQFTPKHILPVSIICHINIALQVSPPFDVGSYTTYKF